MDIGAQQAGARAFINRRVLNFTLHTRELGEDSDRVKRWRRLRGQRPLDGLFKDRPHLPNTGERLAR
jgi:hypothetical protein